MIFKLKPIFGLVLIQFSLYSVKATILKDLIKIAAQLQEGVDGLQYTVMGLNDGYNNQEEFINNLQTKFLMDAQEDEDSVCQRLNVIFNSTSKNYRALEDHIATKLSKVKEEKTTNLKDVLQEVVYNCPKIEPKLDSAPITDTLSKLSKKVLKFDNKFEKLDLLQQQFNLQQTNFKKYIENQSKILQEINTKLLKNQQQFVKFDRDLTSLKDLQNKMNQEVTTRRPRLPKDLLFGLSSSKATAWK